MPRLDGPRLALQGVRRPVVDVELDELLYRDEGVVIEQDGGGALQYAVRLGVIAYDLPQLDAVRLGELDATEHVGEGVWAAVAHASLVDADAAWPQALSERPEGRRTRASRCVGVARVTGPAGRGSSRR